MQSYPISVMIVTKNEERNIARCLESLPCFDEIIIIDSSSSDNTISTAQAVRPDVQHVNFQWNGQYPKKRQWCLEHIKTRYDWVLFLDADEVLTDRFVNELEFLDLQNSAGYFIKSSYIINGQRMRFGLKNNKLCLFHKEKFVFPMVKDIENCPLGEIEGHYQPVLKDPHTSEKIGQIKAPIDHYTMECSQTWQKNHKTYALWEKQQSGQSRNIDPVPVRYILKKLFNKNVFLRPYFAFLHSYIVKCGFLDGKNGFILACSRYEYYKMAKNA